MANVIKIKRGEGVPTTSDLKHDGELGYDKQTNKLYINRDNTVLEVNQFKVGGRNYLRDSDTTVIFTGSYILPIYGYAAPLVGENVVFSFDMMTHTGGTLRNVQVYSYQESGVTIAKSPILQASNTEFEKWERFSLSTSIQRYPIPEGFTPGAVGFYDAGGDNSFSLRNFKLEKGNVATDWTPAPEDIQANIADEVTNKLSDPVIQAQFKGDPGEDGAPTYTWIRYADTASGGGISNDPTGKAYIGFAYNKDTATESDTAGDYTWSLIQGPQGDTGVKGDTGADGQTLYTWIKYSDNADGTGLYDAPKASTLYIGIATNKTTATETTVKTDYVWSKFKGPQGDEGPQGVQGPKGDDGTSQYVYIRYSANSNGNPMTTSPQATTKYIGLANTTSSTAPTGYASYKWSLVKGSDGEQGPQGIQGPAGENGQPTYTWVKYADTPTTGMNDYPDGKKYIGLAFNKTTPTESTSYSAYQWSLMPQNLRVGGRNLLLGSGERVSNEYHSIAYYDLTDDIQEGEDVTLTIWGSLAPTKSYFEAEMFGNPAGFGALTDNEDGTYSNTFKWWGPTDDLFLIYVYPDTQTGISTINKIKLEKGNTATDWTPAPEDIDAKFSEQDVKFNEQDTTLADLTTISQTNTSLINQTNEEITSLVTQETHQTSLNGLQEHLEGYVSGEVDTRITTYSSEVNQTFDNITLRFDSVTNNIDSLGNVLQDSLDGISTYIRFSEDGIELGKQDNPIKLFIENDRIVFTQNDVEVAYIDNNRLYITDGQFLNSLRLGNFAFTPRDNGNLSFGKVV